MDDLNAKVGESNEGCEGITGKHGAGTINDNGDRLVSFAAFNNLIITGTIFPHRMRNQIDHVLLSRQHRTLVLDTRAMRGADVASDHHLVRTELRLKIKRHRIKKVPNRKRFNTVKLQQLETRNQFSLTFRNEFDLLQVLDDNDENVKHIWQGLQRAYTETAKDVLGFSDDIQKRWMSNSSWKLIDKKKAVRNELTEPNHRALIRNSDKIIDLRIEQKRQNKRD